MSVDGNLTNMAMGLFNDDGAIKEVDVFYSKELEKNANGDVCICKGKRSIQCQN